MHTLGDMAKALNRSQLYLREVLKRFEVPLAKDDRYSAATLAFLRTVIFLRTLNISEERLRDLWHLEKNLLQLLHVDSAGSPTWFLDACGLTSHPRRRLLLSNFDLGFALPARAVQLGLNFAEVRAKTRSGCCARRSSSTAPFVPMWCWSDRSRRPQTGGRGGLSSWGCWARGRSG